MTNSTEKNPKTADPKESQKAEESTAEKPAVQETTAGKTASEKSITEKPLAKSPVTKPPVAKPPVAKLPATKPPAAKPKNPQAVLFLFTESTISIASEKNSKQDNTPNLIQIPREPLGKIPVIPSTVFSNKIERFFVHKSSTKPTKVNFPDAHLLLFPLRTMRSVFTWVTSLTQLQHFDAQLKDTICAPRWPLVGLDETKILSGPHNACMVKEHVAVEEFNFAVSVETRVQGISRWLAANALPQLTEYQWWRAKIARDLLIVPHELFTQLVQQNLQILALQTNSKTNKTNSSEFFEELLPKESLFYSVLGKSFSNAELELPLTMLGEKQINGYGICRLQLITRANNKVKRNKKKPTSTKPSAQEDKTPKDTQSTENISAKTPQETTSQKGEEITVETKIEAASNE